jgi:hypothetical protein
MMRFYILDGGFLYAYYQMKKIVFTLFFVPVANVMMYGQVSDTKIWDNGFLEDIYGGALLADANDSILVVFNVQHFNVNDSLTFIFLRKDGLSDYSKINIAYPTNAPFAWVYFIRSGVNCYIHESTYDPGLKEETITLSLLSSDLEQLSTVFSDTISNTTLWTRNSGIIDNYIYVMRSRSQNAFPDSLEIRKYDLSGNLIIKRWLNDSIRPAYNNINKFYVWGPYQHPSNPSQIVYGNRLECRVAIVDKTTLDTVSVMKPDPYHFTPMSTYVDGGYQLYPDRITCGGSMFLTYNLPFNPTFDWQYYFDSRSWSGDSLYELRLGKLGFTDKSYAYTSSPAYNQHILAGSGPMNSLFEGPEYREVKLYRFNESGFIDSLLLYGNKNHVPLRLLADPNGDLFMLSTYTDAWTTDSTYFQLDKIPAYLIGLIEDKVVSPKIIIYPNPTADFVRFDVGTMAITTIDVYSQAGQLVKRFKAPGAEGVNIADLPNNLYIFVLHLDDGTRVSSIVAKK